MRALTVQQPWAHAIIHLGKDLENRTVPWTYRGPLVIHAGRRLSTRGLTRVPDITGRWLDPDTLVLGAHIGIVQLVDAHEDTGECCRHSKWAERSYVAHGGRTVRQVAHLVVERPRAFQTPIPALGRLGLWTPPPEDQELIDLQILTSTAGGH